MVKDLFDEQKQNVGKAAKHPLLNPQSSHYTMFDGLEAISILEKLMSISELMAWCRGNIYKYRLRAGNKGDGASDLKKIETYEAYYKYLKERLND